ncbi:hypothetical protein ZIOFF_072314 [Zingiber officinale]|uniref:TF-B3 domain-containing protein n=1 Tax=Zingiber officinale TaxID=94328 RepID=A0A8J5ER54_ZINOF|nr:hypothetical protein ZIOFF_072314 [Zingiber officinale]
MPFALTSSPTSLPLSFSLPLCRFSLSNFPHKIRHRLLNYLARLLPSMDGASKLRLAPVSASGSSSCALSNDVDGGTDAAAEHRATRRRKMVAKQRGRRSRRRPASETNPASVSPPPPPPPPRLCPAFSPIEFQPQSKSIHEGSVLDLNVPALDPDQAVAGLRFLLQKELRNSDVSQLGRIVLPKKEAEAYLPNLTYREGIAINMDDLENLHVWTFKYRFWPNNRSRMYILENTGDDVEFLYAYSPIP